MAANQIAGGQVVNATLTANTADLIYLTGPGFSVRVTNLTGTSPIYFTVSQPGGAATPPTVGGNGCYVAPAAVGANVTARGDFLYGAIVQLISAGTMQYQCEVQSVRATS